MLGEGGAEVANWRNEQLHDLKHEGAVELVSKLRSFAAEHLRVPLVEENLAYLEKRLELMQYPLDEWLVCRAALRLESSQDVDSFDGVDAQIRFDTGIQVEAAFGSSPMKAPSSVCRKP